MAQSKVVRVQSRRGETLVELLMSTILPIVGGITASLLLRYFTSLPLWACLLIGVPGGTVAAWAMFIGGAFIVCKLVPERPVNAPLDQEQAIRERPNDSRHE